MTLINLPQTESVDQIYSRVSQAGLANVQADKIRADQARQEAVSDQNRTLSNLKMQGLSDPKSRAIAIQLDPDYGIKLQNYEAAKQDYEAKDAVFWGQQTAAAAQAPLASRPRLYSNIYEKAKASGKDISMFPLPSDKWTEAHQGALEYISQQAIEPAKQLEMRNKQQDINLKERRFGLEQQKLDLRREESDIDRSYKQAQIDKMRSDLSGGSEVKAIKKAETERKIQLPRIKADTKMMIKVIDGILNHPGKSSMVGAKNIFSGAVGTLIPFTDRSPVAGSKAADFKARFDQLQGKNFLQAFQSLKGGGQITENEGKKATDAISRMSLSQSEEEFNAAAEELKSIVRGALKRASTPVDELIKEDSNQDNANDPLGIR